MKIDFHGGGEKCLDMGISKGYNNAELGSIMLCKISVLAGESAVPCTCNPL